MNAGERGSKTMTSPPGRATTSFHRKDELLHLPEDDSLNLSAAADGSAGFTRGNVLKYA